jgi:putative flippase GtrA
MNKRQERGGMLQYVTWPNRQLVAYVISGVTALVIDNGIFLLFLYVLRTPLVVAVVVGLTSGLIASFALNRQWAFRRDASHLHSGTKQFILYMSLFAFNNLFTYLFIKLLLTIGVVPAISKIAATVCITLWNYLAYKNIIFR